ncbi:hypothetical protein EJD97_018604 [Solanum chilense]|uniref:Uncharacterized protein n=1 Tax=Solanum chilense TaxID=4083 RepID=A0A6N2B0L7_SOLCI|nr:hypothetical protein EJD97_018604 [Solanum chilense]
MPSHNVINLHSRIILDSSSRLYRDKVGKLSQSVHNKPYGIMLPSSIGKTNHEVHINGLSLPSRNLNNLSQITRLKMLCLNLLIIRTLGYVFSNVHLHTIPLINVLKVMIHYGGTWVHGISGTMGLCNNPGLQIIYVWYTQPVLIPKYAITSQSERLSHLHQS